MLELKNLWVRYGKKAAVDIHRGPAQHTNGFYNVLAWMTINMLLGNFDAKGGMIKATAYSPMGAREAEAHGLLAYGSSLIYTNSTNTQPMLTVCLRKASGAGYYAMTGMPYVSTKARHWSSPPALLAA